MGHEASRVCEQGTDQCKRDRMTDCQQPASWPGHRQVTDRMTLIGQVEPKSFSEPLFVVRMPYHQRPGSLSSPPLRLTSPPLWLTSPPLWLTIWLTIWLAIQLGKTAATCATSPPAPPPWPPPPASSATLVSNSTLLACTLSTLLVSPGNCACGGDQVTSWLSAQMHVQDVTLSGRVAQACACAQMTLWPGCDAELRSMRVV